MRPAADNRRSNTRSSAEADQDAFVDGSGYHQQCELSRLSTWAAIRGPSRDADGSAREVIRGRTEGWIRTVPRSEIRGSIAALEAAAPGARIVLDCAMVVKALMHGVAPAL